MMLRFTQKDQDRRWPAGSVRVFAIHPPTTRTIAAVSPARTIRRTGSRSNQLRVRTVTAGAPRSPFAMDAPSGSPRQRAPVGGRAAHPQVRFLSRGLLDFRERLRLAEDRLCRRVHERDVRDLVDT